VVFLGYGYLAMGVVVTGGASDDGLTGDQEIRSVFFKKKSLLIF